MPWLRLAADQEAVAIFPFRKSVNPELQSTQRDLSVGEHVVITHEAAEEGWCFAVGGMFPRAYVEFVAHEHGTTDHGHSHSDDDEVAELVPLSGSCAGDHTASLGHTLRMTKLRRASAVVAEATEAIIDWVQQMRVLLEGGQLDEYEHLRKAAIQVMKLRDQLFSLRHSEERVTLSQNLWQKIDKTYARYNLKQSVRFADGTLATLDTTGASDLLYALQALSSDSVDAPKPYAESDTRRRGSVSEPDEEVPAVVAEGKPRSGSRTMTVKNILGFRKSADKDSSRNRAESGDAGAAPGLLVPGSAPPMRPSKDKSPGKSPSSSPRSLTMRLLRRRPGSDSSEPNVPPEQSRMSAFAALAAGDASHTPLDLRGMRRNLSAMSMMDAAGAGANRFKPLPTDAVKAVGAVALRHLLVNIAGFHVSEEQLPEPLELHFSLFLQKSQRFVTDSFFLEYEHGEFLAAKSSSEGGASQRKSTLEARCVLFRDVEASDIEDGIVLVCRIIRKAVSKDDGPNRPRQLYAVAVRKIEENDWKHRAQKLPSDVARRRKPKPSKRLRRGALNSTIVVPDMSFISFADEQTAPDSLVGAILNALGGIAKAATPSLPTTDAIQLKLDLDILRGDADDTIQYSRSLAHDGLRIESMLKKVPGEPVARLSMAAVVRARGTFAASAQSLVTMARLAVADMTRLIYFRSIASLNDKRNDLYVTVIGSSLQNDKKRIEVSLEVLREDGKNIADFAPNCLQHGTGKGLKTFTTTVLPRQSSPQWNEMVKIVMPPLLANDVYLVFTVRTLGEGSKAATRSEPKAFAYLKLTEEDGGVVSSTRHVLTWYKMPDKKALTHARPVEKEIEEGKDPAEPRIAAYFLAADKQPWSKDIVQTLSISLRLTSTEMSHTAPIVALMAFKQHSKEDLVTAMKNLRSVEASEHKKFAFPLLNALFDMMHVFQDDLKFSDMTFETAILLVCSVSDAEQYGTALREYISQLTNSKLHLHLSKFVERNLELKNAASPTHVKRTLQALPLLFKLMIRSYKVHVEESLMSSGSDDADSLKSGFIDMITAVQKALVGVFLGLQTLSATAGIRAIALQIAPFIFFETLENLENKAVVSQSLLVFFAAAPPASADRASILADAIGAIEKLTFAETMLRTLTRQSYQHRSDPTITQDLHSVADQFVDRVIDFTAHALGIRVAGSDDEKTPAPKEAVIQAAISVLGAVLDHIQASSGSAVISDAKALTPLARVIDSFTTVLLDPKRIKSKKEATIAGLALARLIRPNDVHLRAVLDRAFPEGEQRLLWLSGQVQMCVSLIETSTFPEHWHELSLYCLESIANHVRTLTVLITEAYQSTGLISEMMTLVRLLISAPLLDLRGTSRSHRAALLAHGDLRQRIFIHVVMPLWRSLSPDVVEESSTQEWFISLMVRLFVGRVRDALVHRLSIRCFFENLRVAIRRAVGGHDTMFGRAKVATTEVLEALAAEGFLTPELYEKHLSLDEYVEFHQHATPAVTAAERDLAADFFSSVAEQTGLLFELAKLPEEDDNLGMHDRRVDIMVQIIRHMKEHGRARNYVQYVHKLAELHHANGDYAEEAMVLLRAHAMTIPWSSSTAEFSDPGLGESASELRARVEAAVKAATQNEGRVELFDRIIILLNRAHMSDLALPLVQDLQQYFRRTAPDYKRVISLLQEEARLMQSVMDTERFEPVYYRISFFGGGFSAFDKSLPGTTWVLRCSRLERRADVIARLCDKYPGASVLQTTTVSDDIRQSETAMEMLVMSVLAVDCQELIFLREQIQRQSVTCSPFIQSVLSSRTMAILNSDLHPGLSAAPTDHAKLPATDALKRALQARERDPQFVRVMRKHCNANVFVYQRPFRKDSGKKGDEFEDLWFVNEYCIIEEPLPGTRQWAAVIGELAVELAPIENAINALMAKNAEIDDKVAHFKAVALRRQRGRETDSDVDSAIGPLTMLLNGVIDAAVNGGVAKYQKLFFTDDFISQNPQFAPAVRRLQREVVAHVHKTESALKLHAQLCPLSMIAMQKKLETFFKNIQADLLEPVLAQRQQAEEN